MIVRKNSLKPKPRINLVEWADNFRYLSSKSSAFPGRWKTDRIEPARGPMLAVTDPSIKKITIMSCSQLMKTELLGNIIGYHIHLDPAPIIMMHPTIAMAQAYSKDRLDPMISDSPVLSEMVSEKKSRDSQNTILHKAFSSGQLTLIGANSPSELASRPIRVVLADEVDRYPASSGKEGDPLNLIVERTATFFNSKIIMCSTPTIKGRSRIESEYELSDKRVFKVPCPHCGEMKELEFEHVKWEPGQPETAQYRCPLCLNKWTELERKRSISQGKYEATAPFTGHAGFKVNKIASIWEPLSVLAKKWLESQGNHEKLKTFLNTQLAETWEERGDAPEHMRLYERRESYPVNSIPEGVKFLTAGADVQKDRIEVEIVGWGIGKESWSIDYRVIMGETTTKYPWVELDKLLNETFTNERNQEFQIRVLAVDSGYNTSHVYSWARKYTQNHVMVVKGQDTQSNIMGIPKSADITHAGVKSKRSVNVWPIGVSILKSELYGYLNLNGAGDDGLWPSGYCHFPEYDEHFFKMLTAEQLVKRIVNGKTVFKWIKTFERNEALDCRNYARAAAHLVGIDRFKPRDWDLISGNISTVTSEPVKQKKSETLVQQVNNPNSFWSNSNRKSFW